MITFNKIDLPSQKLAFVLSNIFTKVECQDLIDIANSAGFERAKVVKGDGTVDEINTDIRNHFRTSFFNTDISQFIESRINKWFPSDFKGKSFVGISDFVRYMRYSEGEYFAPHTDTSYIMPNNHQSIFSIIIYLTTDCVGGTTRFLYKGGYTDVTPRIGQVLIFEHDILHEGTTVLSGTKYVMRLDAMYG
jgi:hypothetical protein